MVSAGRVLIMPKGAYDATVTYSMLDLVSYNGSSYIAKTSTTGNLPTNTTYWQLSAYGGNASNIAANFATLETTDYASQNYAIGDYLVTKDSQLCEVIDTITSGDELILDTNIEVTSVEAMMNSVKDYVDDLDEENVKLKGMTAIVTQTDLDTMTTIGNYYKSSTSFYVTNAPTGIASEITAIFRLTVENGSDSADKYLQTLITNDGITYKRGYDGSDWSDWIEFSTAATVATKQPKTLETSITIGGAVRTTVEGALGALEDAKADTSGLGTAAFKDTTDAVTNGSTDPVESGAVYTALTNQTANKVLYFTGAACAATTGNFTSLSNAAITADHVVAECVFANPSAITTDVTWTTASGSLTLNGTCASSTTVNMVLVKKDN